MRNNIRKYRQALGLTRAQLAEKVGISHSHMTKIENGERGLRMEWLDKFGEALGVSPLNLIALGTRLVGRVGAGAAIQPIEEDGDWDDDTEVESPPGATDKTVAVGVQGESMPGIAHDGWLLYYNERFDPPDSSFVGKLCVVWCEDGRVLVKTLGFGSEQGLWSLISSSGAIEKDVALKYAALVEWIKPR